MSVPTSARARLGFGLIGPRRSRHTVSVEQLASMALPLGDDGMVIGVDAEGRPAVLGINRPTPYDVTLIGGLWTAQVLALRAAATGARIVVETGRAHAWTGLAQAAGVGSRAFRCTMWDGCHRRAPRPAARWSWCGTAGCGRRAGEWCPGPGSR